MAADPFGAVPPFYREMYDIVCPKQENVVDQDMFIKLLVKSSLPKQTLTQIWEMVDTGHGYLSRTGLYKALALVAFAQQGKQLSDKLLGSFAELPKPSLGDLSDLRLLSIRLRREKNPARLGLNYEDICSLDTVRVTVVPERKGIFLKHVEYEVSSLHNKSNVQRRYNDFLALHELLLQKFPYRLIPNLPPKKVMGADSQFIEERRKALRRFLTLLARHPVIAEDKILQFFLTFSGTDVQHKMKEHFRGTLDEFHTNERANEAEELLPIDSVNQMNTVREQMKQIYAGVVMLKDCAERLVERSREDATDLVVFGKELCSLAGSSSSGSDWGTGGNETWDHLKKRMKNCYPVYSNVSKAFDQLASEMDNDVVEELNLFLDILSAYKDLCERYETVTGLQRQRAASKLKSRPMSQISVEAEAQAAQQQEKRSHFFLHCIHMETQLIHTYMEVMVKVLKSTVELQSKGYSQVSMLWQEALPLVQSLIPNGNVATPTSTISR